MKNFKKFFALLLAFVLVFSIPTAVRAEDGAVPAVTVEAEAEAVSGKVIEVQKYGNLTMDIKPAALYDADFELGDVLKVTVGKNTLSMPFCTSYSDVDTGSMLVRDSKDDDILIVAINMGNFSTTYNVAVGDTVTFEIEEKEGYLAEYLLRQLARTDVRKDYKSDEIFANFRSVETSGITPGILYRSSSPINNEIGRAAYADKLVEAAGIETVINLADAKTDIRTYVKEEGFASEYYRSLYKAGKVKLLSMGVDIAGEEFGTKLAKGLRFMSKKEGPYLIHCTEGKDRAGFVVAVLEALMGASFDEIVADYMVTYENYYGVEKDSEQYEAIAKSNIIASLTTVMCGLDKDTDISDMELTKKATAYLKKIGLKNREIKALKAKLSAEAGLAGAVLAAE